MNLRLVPLSLAVAVAMAVPFADAQTVPWRAVIGTNSSVVVPGLPSTPRSYGDILLSDAGAGRVGVRMTSSGMLGYWAYRQGAWAQYMKEGVTGALGPGRSGGESAHVFLDYSSGFGAAGFDGQRVFVAKAGAPNDTVNATWGVWRWDQQKNVEIVRVLTDGALGPGKGPNWAYAAGTSFGARDERRPRPRQRGRDLADRPGQPTAHAGDSRPGQPAVHAPQRDLARPRAEPHRRRYLRHVVGLQLACGDAGQPRLRRIQREQRRRRLGSLQRRTARARGDQPHRRARPRHRRSDCDLQRLVHHAAARQRRQRLLLRQLPPDFGRLEPRGPVLERWRDQSPVSDE
jgi:hypothetical protein